jgi:hypothetical protein
MLDENLRVLTRRMNDLEIELADKKDKLKTMERANAMAKTELDSFGERQDEKVADLERQFMDKLDAKESESRRLREEI